MHYSSKQIEENTKKVKKEVIKKYEKNTEYNEEVNKIKMQLKRDLIRYPYIDRDIRTRQLVWQRKDGDEVEAGEIIAKVFEINIYKGKDLITNIKASSSGRLFRFVVNYTKRKIIPGKIIGVISDPNDSRDDVLQWSKERYIKDLISWGIKEKKANSKAQKFFEKRSG